jgi:hypothetical protein
MPHIMLTDEQALVVASTSERVRVYDAGGNLLGVIVPASVEDDIAETERLFPSSRMLYTHDQVQARLRALEQEWDRTGGFDKGYMRQFLAALNAADPGHLPPEQGIDGVDPRQ